MLKPFGKLFTKQKVKVPPVYRSSFSRWPLINWEAVCGQLSARSLADTSSSSHYSSQFQKFERTMKSKSLKFKSNNTENYNLSFSIVKLKQALQKSNNSVAGPDNICCNLPESVLSVLLKVHNYLGLRNLPSLMEGNSCSSHSQARYKSQASHKLQA